MDHFLEALVRQMFALCKVGIAFNVMSSYVNFTAPNLYYRSPVEMLAWCMSEVSTKVMLDHAYTSFNTRSTFIEKTIPKCNSVFIMQEVQFDPHRTDML